MAEKEIKTTEQTDMDKLTTEMMEHICDNLCKHPCNANDQEELEDICAECKMGKFVCDILNAHNRLKKPCKAGDKVYQADSAGNIFESKITKIIYDTNGIAFDESAIGKTVFLTKQEAQAALEEMNRDKPKQYVLVSQGIEIYRTTDKDEAERMMNESNDKYYEYLQRCADEGERPADNMIYLYEEE